MDRREVIGFVADRFALFHDDDVEATLGEPVGESAAPDGSSDDDGVTTNRFFAAHSARGSRQLSVARSGLTCRERPSTFALVSKERRDWPNCEPSFLVETGYSAGP